MEKLNKPLSPEQLEKVWEEQDHRKKEEWDPAKVRVHLESPPFPITRNFFFKYLTYIPTQLKKRHNRKNGGEFGRS